VPTEASPENWRIKTTRLQPRREHGKNCHHFRSNLHGNSTVTGGSFFAIHPHTWEGSTWLQHDSADTRNVSHGGAGYPITRSPSRRATRTISYAHGQPGPWTRPPTAPFSTEFKRCSCPDAPRIVRPIRQHLPDKQHGQDAQTSGAFAKSSGSSELESMEDVWRHVGGLVVLRC